MDGYKHIKGTKIHAVVLSEALPLSIQVGPGDEHDSNHLIPLLEDVRVKHGKGKPKDVVGDSVYDTKENRENLKRKGVKANIDVNLRRGRKPKRGRPYRLDGGSYRSMRSAVERFLAWIKHPEE